MNPARSPASAGILAWAVRKLEYCLICEVDFDKSLLRKNFSKIKGMNCPFCNIDKQKTVIIKETKNILVIFSNPKLMDGHLLVIPKKHVEKLSELSKEDRNELFQTAIDFQEKILAKVSKGCDIRQNYRPFQEQNDLKVNHLHIHLQPREFEDELYSKCQISENGIFGELDKDKAKLIMELLR